MEIHYTMYHIRNSSAQGFDCNTANSNSSAIVWYVVGQYCGDLTGLTHSYSMLSAIRSYYVTLPWPFQGFL